MLLATSHGRKFDFNDLKPEDFRIQEIAHALSNICRFGGHSPEFYSVAQHCAVACKLMYELQYDEEIQRTTLMHDASEAYLGDVVRHIKHAIPFYGDMENSMMTALATRFRFTWPLPDVVKTVDHDMLETEMLSLWRGKDLSWRPTYGVPMKIRIKPVYPHVAKHLFMEEALRLGIS